MLRMHAHIDYADYLCLSTPRATQATGAPPKSAADLSNHAKALAAQTT